MSTSAWHPLVPLALAASAVLAREATRPRPREVGRLHGSTEFRAPDLALLGAVAGSESQTLHADASRSRACLDGERVEAQVRGHVQVAARDDGWRLEFELEHPSGDVAIRGAATSLKLRLFGADGHSSAVPGCRTANLRGTWSLGALGGDLQLPISWMRLPGGGARLQGVGTLRGYEWEQASGALLASASASATVQLSLDVVLEREERAR
jgi:hypothetical protein